MPATYIYQSSTGESAFNLELMWLIDEQFLETPYYGARQMARHSRRQGYCVSRKRNGRLMRKMGFSAIYQKPNTSKPHPEYKIYPYLLRGVAIDRSNKVWCSDITYIPMRRDFLYLVAIMDWHSRKFLGGCQTASIPTFVLQHWKKPWRIMARPRYSIPTRVAASLQVILSPRS